MTYDADVNITYDAAKSARNVRERGLSFEEAERFDFSSAASGDVFRNGEWRIQAVGYLEDRLHVLCFKQTPEGMRVISFRKANDREARRYGFELRR